MKTDSCVFCDIVAGVEPAAVVERFETAIVIEPLYPVVDGHLLVIPKLHVPDAVARPTITGQVFALAAIVAARYGSANLITSVGVPATQSVFHLHVHVVPRVAGDGLLLPWSHPDTVRRTLDKMVVEDRPEWSRTSRSGQPLDVTGVQVGPGLTRGKAGS